MKKFFFLFVCIFVLSACSSGHKRSIETKMSIPSGTEFERRVSRGLDSRVYYWVRADSNNDGLTDLRVLVDIYPLTIKLCYLKFSYPDEDIKIAPNSVSWQDSCWALTSEGIYVRE